MNKVSIGLTLILLLSNFLFGQHKIDVTETFGDRLVIGMVANPFKVINPYQISSLNQKEIVNLIFGYGLLQKPGKYDVAPTLLERLVYNTENSDNKIWRLVLNRNIVFQDGSLLLNSDVKFTYDLIKKFGGHILNRRLDFRNIKNISIEGDLEVRFELYQPDPNFYEELNDIPIISRRYYASAMEEGYAVFSEKPPMGIGPFSLAFKNTTAINLKYHNQYFTGRPFLDDITIEFFDNEEQMIDALTNGNIDYIEIKDRVTAQRLHDLMGSNIIVIGIPRPNKKVYFILPNLKHFPLSDEVVRKAVKLSINRKEISQKFEIKEIARTLIDADNPHYFKTAFRGDDYNPILAAQLLRNSGWKPNQKTGILEKNGRPLSLSLHFAKNSFFEESIARSLKISLGELNINLQPIPVEPARKDELIQNGQYDLLIYSYTYDPQYLFEAVEQFYFDILKGNLSDPNYQNSYLDQLINLSYRDSSIKDKLFQRFQFYLKQEAPVFFLLFDQQIIVAVNSRFHSFRKTYRENDHYYYRLEPFENWFVPKILQRYSTSGDLE